MDGPSPAKDFNLWGVTFTPDSKSFYCTLSTNRQHFLVRGDIAQRTATVVHENVECPSLSPDGKRIAYKKRLPVPGRVEWQLHVLDLASSREIPLAEKRSADDQIEWLDDDNVLYALSSERAERQHRRLAGFRRWPPAAGDLSHRRFVTRRHPLSSMQAASPTLAFVVALAAQVPHAPPPLTPSGRSRDSARVERVYGTPEPVDVWSLTYGTYHRHTVVTKGRVDPLDLQGGYFELSDQNGRVVLFAVPEIQEELSQFLGKRVEVVGLARDLVESQGTCLLRMQQVPQSICDDPELPPTPDLTPGRASWPRVSVTIWSITDITPLDGKIEEDFATALGGSPGEKVRLRGRFGGANLEGVLASRAPEPGAWVLLSHDGAVWVIGKPPRGKGWNFDPRYRGDLGKRLEVEGVLARCGTETCVRARRVFLAGARGEPEP